jgi:glycosyltransferase involved in cell wall biosynthesis
MKSRRVLLVADVEGWAYDIIAKSISGSFRKYRAEIAYFRDLIDRRVSIDGDDYDVIFAFFWYDMLLRGKLIDNLDSKKVCVDVQSHNSWLKRGIGVDEVEKVLNSFTSVGFSSKKLMRKFPNLENKFYTPSGFDPRRFTPSPLPEFDGRLKICWAGDPETSHHGDVKGYYEFIRPAIEEFDDVELITASKQNRVPHNKMGSFYSRGHVYLNFSSSEGTPMPLLESMACGRAVITTNVGISEEVVKDGENGWVIPRTLESLVSCIDNCRKQMSDLQMMGLKAYKSVEERTYDWSAMHYEELFDSVYDS